MGKIGGRRRTPAPAFAKRCGVDLDALRRELADVPALASEGRVRAVTGLSVRASLPGARVGDVVRIHRRGEPLSAQIVGFEAGEVIALPFGPPAGVGVDDRVESTGAPLTMGVGPGLLGRVLDGFGRPADGEPLPAPLVPVPVDRAPPAALGRQPIVRPLATGVRAIDGLMTLAAGQRVGLFSGSGVGKSTLLGAMARGAVADVIVVALVGERGREVLELVETILGFAKERSVVVVSTSDAPAFERLHAAQVATTAAEYFRDAGQDVLLLVDSITRVARAQREIGLAAGEPPARRGFPPSVFSMLPRLLERAGAGPTGTITALYTVLVEGDDLDEPVADEVRAILDGHIVLSRAVAARGHYPAIDVMGSLSRVMPRVVSRDHLAAAATVRSLVAAYEEKRDLIQLGAYERGSDAGVDRAIQAKPAVDRFLRQSPDEPQDFVPTVRQLAELAAAAR